IFFFQAEDGIRDPLVTGVQTCALPISSLAPRYVQVSRHRKTSRKSSLSKRTVLGPARTDPGAIAQRSAADVLARSASSTCGGVEIGRASCRERVRVGG